MSALCIGRSDPGVRRVCNQDAYGFKVMEFGGEEAVFAVVCDGIGGMSAGELASRTTVEAFLDWFQASADWLFTERLEPGIVFARWSELVNDISGRICAYGHSHDLRMGTTAAAVLLINGTVFSMNVGDSRIYRLGAQPRQLSRDHTLVQREVEQGKLTPAQARQDTRRNVLVRCVGAEPKALPDFYTETVDGPAAYLLCTDGFYRTLPGQALPRGFARRNFDAAEISVLLKNSIAAAMERGERDNITALLVCAGELNGEREDTVDLNAEKKIRQYELYADSAERI